MPSFLVTYSGMEEFMSEMQGMRERVPGAIQELMDSIGADTKDSMDNFTHVRSGTLRAGNTVIFQDNGFELRNNVYYASFVEFGTRKMEARPYLAPAVEVGIQLLISRAPTVFEKI